MLGMYTKRALSTRPAMPTEDLLTRVWLMLEAHSSSCNSTYFDDVRITRARTEDYVMALRDSTRDSTGHVDLHMVRLNEVSVGK